MAAARPGHTIRGRATIIAHENVLNRMSAPTGKQSSRPTAAWPNDTFFDEEKDGLVRTSLSRRYVSGRRKRPRYALP